MPFNFNVGVRFIAPVLGVINDAPTSKLKGQV